MDIIIPHSLLTEYLETKATPEVIAKHLSLCGPTVDQLEKTKDDWLYHIEIITNRVDSASAFGVAREAVAILTTAGIEAKLIHQPDSKIHNPESNQPVNVKIINPHLVPRFTCVALDHIQIKPSPLKTQNWLNFTGERPLNNVIDVSNELTLRFGQPVHVFDLDLIKHQKMLVRESQPGEKVLTLDNRTHNLLGGDIVIEDGEGRLIDLCGIMGGGLSAVNDKTTRVLLFVQTYDPAHIRKTSLYTQERTLASQLFEKQPDPEMVLPVLLEGIKMLEEWANGKLISKILDIYPQPPTSRNLSLDLYWLENFIGTKISLSEITSILNHLGFTVHEKNQILNCTIPSWRLHDVAIKEDLAEEIARVYGYYRLPSIIPLTNLPLTSTDLLLQWEQVAKQALVTTGFTEVYNNSLVSTQSEFKLKNPLSEELVYMRDSLVPSLLQNLEHNRGTSKLPLRLFELANIYLKKPNGNLAEERSTLSLVTQGVDYATVKGYLEVLTHALKINLTYKPGRIDRQVLISASDHLIGQIEVRDQQIISVELNFALLSQSATSIHHFTPIPQYPSIIEDLTFTLPVKTMIGPVIESIYHLDPQLTAVNLKTIYQQNYTFTLGYSDPAKTLTDTDALRLRTLIIKSMASLYHAPLVGKLQ